MSTISLPSQPSYAARTLLLALLLRKQQIVPISHHSLQMISAHPHRYNPIAHQRIPLTAHQGNTESFSSLFSSTEAYQFSIPAAKKE
jgi:hypothetical protein